VEALFYVYKGAFTCVDGISQSDELVFVRVESVSDFSTTAFCTLQRSY